MNAFLSQTNALLKSRKLDSTDAQTLIDQIELVIDATLTGQTGRDVKVSAQPSYSDGGAKAPP